MIAGNPLYYTAVQPFDAVLSSAVNPLIPQHLLQFMQITYNNYKPLVFFYASFLNSLRVKWDDEGVYNLTDDTIESFMKGIAQGRFWNR